MKSVEITGKNLDEIRAEAAAQLGVTEDQVDVEVVEEKRALLGLLGSSIVARATVRSAPEEEPEGPSADEETAPEETVAQAPTADIASEPSAAADDQLARLANRAEQVAGDILDKMGVAVQARAIGIAEEEVTIDLSGDDIALIIGKHGDTLDALQLLVAIIANRGSEVNARVVIDAEDYRDRRRRALEATAASHAAKAKQTDREVVVRDLKAYERRIMHLALRDDPEVETYSEGEGRHRNLVISPVPSHRQRDAEPTDSAGESGPSGD